MKSFIARHFPENAAGWKKYSKIFIPIMLATTLVAFNGMIDNFMVGHIEQGGTALSAVNSWTNILMGLFMAISAAGSVVMAQFFHAKDYKVVKEIVRFRYLLSLGGALILVILSLTIRQYMIDLFIHKPSSSNAAAMHAYDLANKQADKYLDFTLIQWIMMAFTVEMGNQLREIGHGKITLVTSACMIALNASFNAVFMYGLHMGVEGAALSTAISRVLNLIILPVYMYKKKLEILISPLSVFKLTENKKWFKPNISKPSVVLYLKRWVYFTSVFTVIFFITFRNHFYDEGYGVGSLGTGVGAMSVLALTGAFMNIFTTTFSALPSMAANFVGSELGKGNIAQARKNSDQLKGYNTTVAFLLSIGLVITSFLIPYMTFLSPDKKDATGALSFDSAQNLEQVKYSTLVIACYYPIWIWFSTSYRNGNAGGKGGIFALLDWVISGPIQLGWAALLAYSIVPGSDFMQHHFWVAYAIFFTTDLLKLITMEYFYYKYKWLHVLTKVQVVEEKAQAEDIQEVTSERI